MADPEANADKNKLTISIVSSYDSNEGIAADVILTPTGTSAPLRESIDLKDAAKGKSINLPSSGIWRVEIRPRPPTGQKNGPKIWGEDMRRTVTISENRPTIIVFEITRKQAVLYNIPVTFAITATRLVNGESPWYELHSASTVSKHYATIRKEAAAVGLQPDLVSAIMYMETTHGYYEAPLRWIDKNNSILPMNVRADYWADLGWSRADLQDPAKNIKAGVLMLKRISDRVSQSSVAAIATLYNDLGRTTVTDYGARVEAIYREKTWTHKTGFQRNKEEIQRFKRTWNRASQRQKVDILRQIFGGQ